MKKRIATLLALSLCIVIYTFAQQSGSDDKQKQKQAEEEVVKLSTTLVQIDAVVTDRDGRHIKDLKPEEFQIFQDGKLQKITNFSYIVNQPDKPEPMPVKATKNEKNDKNNDATAPIGVTGLKREQVKRTIAIVVNDFTRESLSVDNVLYVQKAIRNFITEQMQPGDLVAIIRTRKIGGTIQQFTTNKQELLAAAERIYEGPSSATFQDDGQCGGAQQEQCEFSDFGQVYFTGSTLGALEYIIAGMRNLPGRKSVLFMSQGLQFDYENPSVKQQIYRLITDANRASVVINTLDPRGLPVLLGPMFSASTATVSGAARSGARPPDIGSVHMGYLSSQGGLSLLAKETGGLFYHDNNDLSAGVRKLINDQNGYYLIAYQPEEGTFDRKNLKFHTWKVRVTRPGLVVRARSGFLGISDEEATPVRKTRNDQLAYALTTPFGSQDIPIKMTGVAGSDPVNRPEVNLLVHVDPRALTFSDEADGAHKATVDVLAVTFGDNGKMVDQIGSTQTVVARGEMYQKILRDGLLITANIVLKHPGGYQLRVAVRDVASERTGSASQFVIIPNVKNGRLAMSGIVAAGSQSAQDPNEAQSGAALRKLKTGMTLDYGYTIYNPTLDQTGKETRLKVENKLYKDDKLVFSDKPTPLSSADSADLKQIHAVGSMKLGNDLSPGEYVLQVVITDELIKQKRNKVSQWVTFEIVQ